MAAAATALPTAPSLHYNPLLFFPLLLILLLLILLILLLLLVVAAAIAAPAAEALAPPTAPSLLHNPPLFPLLSREPHKDLLQCSLADGVVLHTQVFPRRLHRPEQPRQGGRRVADLVLELGEVFVSQDRPGERRLDVGLGPRDASGHGIGWGLRV